MIVNVDEARSEDQAVRVEHTFAGSGREFADSNDAIASDTESAFVEWNAGAVGELGVEDEGRGVGCWRICLRKGAESQGGGKGEQSK